MAACFSAARAGGPAAAGMQISRPRVRRGEIFSGRGSRGRRRPRPQQSGARTVSRSGSPGPAPTM
jgi:ribosomal protein L15E